MAEGAQSRFSLALQEVREGRSSRQVATQHQGVDEETDQPFRLRPVAAGHGGAHSHVVLPGVAREEGVEHGQQGHEERRPAVAGERLEPGRQLQRQREAKGVGVEAPLRGRRAVHRQVERRQAGEPLPPVVHLRLQPFAAQLLALPAGEVGVLDRQLRQRRGLTPRERQVEGPHLAQEHADRPAVGHDMVHGDQKSVIAPREREEQNAQQRPGGEIERPEQLAPRQPPRLGLGLRSRQVREVDARQEHGRGREHDLHRLAPLLGEPRSQRRVPAHDFVQGRGEGLRLEPPHQAHRRRDDAPGLAVVQAVEEPEALLGERHDLRHARRRLRPRDRGPAPGGPRRRRWHGIAEPRGQLPRRPAQALLGQLPAPVLGHLRLHPAVLVELDVAQHARLGVQAVGHA